MGGLMLIHQHSCYNASGPTGCISTLSALTRWNPLQGLEMADESLPKTRAAAMAAGALYYFTGKPCIRGHVMKRMTKGGCVGCLAIQAAARAERRRDQFNADGDYFFTGVPCKNGHIDKRRVRDGRCCACHREHAAARYKADPAPNIAYSAAWAARNPGARTANSRAWRERTNADPERRAAYLEYMAGKRVEHAETRRAWSAKWHRENFEKASEKFKAYYRSNPERYHAHRAKYLARQLQRTPAWLTDADYEAIKAFYAEAIRLTAETGIPHEVDHIIPMQGRTVSGLHVPSNLQVVTRTANRSKGNKHAD
jgi:hypothetical protein